MENLKLKTEDLEVEYEILPTDDNSNYCAEIAELDTYFEKCQKKADKYNSELERLTNDADWIDYTVAVASGVLSGLMDVFLVGELDLIACNVGGSEKIHKFV